MGNAQRAYDTASCKDLECDFSAGLLRCAYEFTLFARKNLFAPSTMLLTIRYLSELIGTPVFVERLSLVATTLFGPANNDEELAAIGIAGVIEELKEAIESACCSVAWSAGTTDSRSAGTACASLPAETA